MNGLRGLLTLMAMVVAHGCGGSSGDGAKSGLDRLGDRDAGTVPGGPGSGQRYGLGRAATVTQIAAWNTDIAPDGQALPLGKGTVTEGAALYAAQCQQCHGTKGEGMAPAYPALIGRPTEAEGFVFAKDPKLVRTIGNYWSHATTLYDYVKRAMPLTAPGSLTDDQVYALTAYLLAANGVIPDTTTLDAAALRAVKMPYADRFVADDRRGGAEIK
jgi:mono/diheme cytochrome c family protein